jgi:hypothetical protein
MMILREILNWLDKAEIGFLILFFGYLLLPIKALEERMRRKRALMANSLPEVASCSGKGKNKIVNPN